MHSSSAVPAAPMHNLYADGLAKPPTHEACEREQREALNPDVPAVAATCPSCESHNVSSGNCADCGLTDNLSAFMGGGMTANAKFEPSKFAKSGGSARTFDSAPRGWTISGGVD